MRNGNLRSGAWARREYLEAASRPDAKYDLGSVSTTVSREDSTKEDSSGSNPPPEFLIGVIRRLRKKVKCNCCLSYVCDRCVPPSSSTLSVGSGDFSLVIVTRLVPNAQLGEHKREKKT